MRVIILSATLALSCAFPILGQQQGPADDPLPVRNDVAQSGDELLVLRHQKFKKGGHENYYRMSRDGVWPWFEKIGTRIVGQWQVVYPGDKPASEEYDEGYRLARYRSYEHWEATRRGQSLGGNGPDYQKNGASLRARQHFVLGSDGAYFLQGHMAPGGPYYLPGLAERYEAADEGSTPKESGPWPVRNDVAWSGQEIVTLRYWKIKKGSFEQFHRESVEGVWPYFEKVGARVVGQWKVVHPEASGREESPDHDEVLMMTRYASHEHWKATRPSIIAALGGNGPDYRRLRQALATRRSISSETWVRFLRGYMHHSPPVFLPGLRETYKAIE